MSASERDPYAAFRYSNYRLYAAGNLVSGIGGQMQSVAVGWEIYERTGAPIALGLAGLAQALPVILLSLPAGQVADRYNRLRVAQIGQFFQVLVALGLAAISHFGGPIAWVYALLFLNGIAGAFSGPASASLLPQLVPVAVMPNAVTWNSSRGQLASVAGPALGGLAIAALGTATPVYLLKALGCTTLIAFLMVLRLAPLDRPRAPVTLESLLAGLRFVRQTKLILATITLDMFGVLFGGATSLLPIFAKDILHAGPAGLGYLRAAPSVGALMMTLLLAHRAPMRHAGKALLWAIAGFGAATIGFGLSHYFWLSFFMLLLTGVFDNISVVIRHTLVLLLTPDAMRGRVSAVNSVFIGISNEVGEFESGVVAQFLGPVLAVVTGGLGTLLVLLAVLCRWPQVAALGRLEDASAEAEASAKTAVA